MNTALDNVLRLKEMATLREVAEAATKCKARKRRYIRSKETLTVGQVSDMPASEKAGTHQEGEKATKRVCARRRCSRCRQPGHTDVLVR